MAHAEVCPLCHGRGVLPVEDGTSATKICHGCGGRGWVQVEDTLPIIPFNPHNPDYPYNPWWVHPIYC